MKLDVGIIGCGNISGIYCKRLKEFSAVNVLACADLDGAKATACAAQHNIPQVLAPAALLAHPEIDVVVNLTVPLAHYDVARAALEHGKHVYNEKPLATELAQGKELCALAKRQKRLIGCAPDTFLGGGLQTCRKLVDDGAIGRPVAATAFMMCHGHESWHPSPEFYYKPGGGPLLDMGPYYLTALVALLGPVARVCGGAQMSFAERTITSQPKHGTVIKVETPTHIAGVLEFVSGAVATVVMSFDVWGARVPCLEVYGTEGSLSLPDPNTFGGPVSLRRPGKEGWEDVPLTHGFAENYRGLGILDLACAAVNKRPARAGGALALHVLEVMHAMLMAGATNKYVAIKSRCERPAPLPPGDNDTILRAIVTA
jgi:predicted dehydrogenase